MLMPMLPYSGVGTRAFAQATVDGTIVLKRGRFEENQCLRKQR